MTKPMTKEEQARRKRKTESVRKLAQQIHKLRRKLTTDMKSDDEKTRLTALAIAIMDKTAERVGNEESAKEGHVGVTGFKNNQIDVDGNTISLKYTGKSGVKQEKQFTDELMAKLLKECKGNCKGDSPVLMTKDGFKIKADKVNRYLKEFGVTAKDIRGYAANTLVTSMLTSSKTPSTPEERQKKFREVLKAVAEKVGHQQATLKRHYLLPGIEESYVKSGNVRKLKNASTEQMVCRLFVAAVAERLVVENLEYYDQAWQAVWELWPKVLQAYRRVTGRDPTMSAILQIGINDWDIPDGKVGSFRHPKEGMPFGLLTVSPRVFRPDNRIYETVVAHELIHMAMGANESPHDAVFRAIADLVGIPKKYQD